MKCGVCSEWVDDKDLFEHAQLHSFAELIAALWRVSRLITIVLIGLPLVILWILGGMFLHYVVFEGR